MRHFKFTLANFFLWATLFIGCFYVENIAVLSPDMNAGFDFSTFWILTICSFACMVMYFYLEHKKNKLRIDKVLLPVFVVLTIIMIVTIWVQKGETYVWENGEGENVVTFTNMEKLQYSIMCVFTMGFAYINIYAMFAHRASNKTLRWLPIVYIIYTYFTIFYSLFTEGDAIVEFFDGKQTFVQCFYHNPNTFGMSLFIGIMTSYLLNYHKSHIFNHVSVLIFFVMIFITGCDTALVLSLVAIPLYLGMEVARNIGRNFKKTVIVTGISMVAAVSILILYFLLSNTESEFIAGINSHIDYFVEHFDQESFTNRIYNWTEMFKYNFDSLPHVLFGRGFMTSLKYCRPLLAAMHNSPAEGSASGENGFVYLMFSTGFIGFALYIGLCGVFGYSCWVSFVNKRIHKGLFYMFAVVLFTAYNCLETNLWFDMGIKETYITIVFLMPLIVDMKYLTNHKDIPEKTFAIKATKTFDPKKVSLIASTILFVAIGSFLPTLLTNYTIEEQSFFQMILITIGVLAALFFVVPYTIYLWLKEEDKVLRMMHVVFNIIGLAFISAVLFVSTNVLVGAIVASALLIIDMVVYAIIRKDFFRSYLKISIIDPIKMSALPLFFAVFLSAGICALLQFACPFNLLTCLCEALLCGVIYSIFLFTLPNQTKDVLFNYLNNNTLYNYKAFLREEWR